MKLNWDDSTNDEQVKEIRKEAVRCYTGIGNAVGRDGIFT